MLQVNFYDIVEDQLLKFAVIVSRSHGKWVFCKHKERDTYECPGGHREAGEDIETTARRELYEESGAVEYSMKRVCVYSVSNLEETSIKALGKVGETFGKAEETYGMLFYADITRFDQLPGYEIEKIELFDQLPLHWTYPEIQPRLLEKIRELITGLE